MFVNKNVSIKLIFFDFIEIIMEPVERRFQYISWRKMPLIEGIRINLTIAASNGNIFEFSIY